MVSPFVLFLLSVSLVSASSQDLCNGPSRFFCRNFSSAKSCNSLDKCLTYWKNERWVQVRTDISAECIYCLHAAQVMKESNARSLCKISKVPSCTDIIDPWRTDNKNQNNSAAFCNVIELCRSHNYLGNLNFGSSICDDCKKIVQDVRVLVSDNATAAAITEKIENYVCKNTPEMFQDYCKETVRIHIPALLHMIEIHINPDDICSLVGLCKNDHLLTTLNDLLPQNPVKLGDSKSHTKCQTAEKFSWINRPSARNHPMWTSLNSVGNKPSGFSDKPSCGQCKEVLDQIRHTLNDPTIRDDIKQEIDQKVCSTLPSFLKQACTKAVNVHFDDIINSLNQADLGEVCATFGMCVADRDCMNAPLTPPGVIPQTQLQPGIPIPGACHLCELVLHKLMDLLVNNKTEASITAALEHICEAIPKTYKDKCQKFVVQYGAQIVEAIVEGTAPKIFCMAIGLCSEHQPVEATQPGPLMLNYCDTCKLFVTVIQQQLQQNQTIDGLENTIKRLCAVLPGSYGDECRSLVDLYLPKVVEYLAKSMSAAEICQEIRLCPSQIELVNTFKDVRQTCQSYTLDTLCRSLELATMCGKRDACQEYQQMRYLRDAMQPSASAVPLDCSICAELVRRWRLSKDLYGRILENGHSCQGYVNEADRALCESIVDKRFAIQQKLMNSMLTAEDVCKQSDCCAANSPANPVTTATEIPLALEAVVRACSVDYKTLCASRRLIEMCGKAHFCRSLGLPHGTHPELLEATTTANSCSWGPSFYCRSEERAQFCGPKAVEHCNSLGFNFETRVVEHRAPVVGGNPCTWGPAYWCSSEENAQSCGSHAVSHCRRMAARNNSSGK